MDSAANGDANRTVKTGRQAPEIRLSVATNHGKIALECSSHSLLSSHLRDPCGGPVMRTLLALPLVLLVPVFLPAEEFAPKNKMYTAMMPTGAKVEQKTQIFPFGKHKAPCEEAQARTPDGTLYVAGSLGIPAVVIREIPEPKRYEAVRDGVAKMLKGKVVEEKDIAHDRAPGKEYLFEIEKKGMARMKLVIIRGWVMYAVVLADAKEKLTAKEAETFYGGFKLSDKAKGLLPK
jgi:hypothetical protein